MTKKRIVITKVVSDISTTVYPGLREYDVLDESETHYAVCPMSGSADRLWVPKEAARVIVD